MPVKMHIKALNYYKDWFGQMDGKREEVFHGSVNGIHHVGYHPEPSLPLFSIRKFTDEVLTEGKYGLSYVSKVLGELGLGTKIEETFVYGGCFHGNEPKLHKELLDINADYAFFSDITGSGTIERGKRIFYNEIVNPAAPLIQKGISNHRLLYNSSDNQHDEKNIRSGYLHLLSFQLFLEGKSDTEIYEEIKRQNDDIIAFELRKIVTPKKFTYYGEWLGRLPKETRMKILKVIASDTKKIISIFKKIKEQGTRVIIVEGNWDNRETLAEIALGENGTPVERYFNTEKYLTQEGFKLYKEIEGITTDTSYHVVAPYFALLKGLDCLPHYFLKGLAKEAKEAKKKKKTVVVYAHGVPYPYMHNLEVQNRLISKDNRKVASQLRNLMFLLQPHEIIYPHFHGLRLTEEKINVPINYDLISNVSKKKVPLVENVKSAAKEHLAANIYIPFRRIAINSLMKRRTAHLFGDSNPVPHVV